MMAPDAATIVARMVSAKYAVVGLLVVALMVPVFLLGPGSGQSDAAGRRVLPTSGKWKGKVGTAARIHFRVKRGRAVMRLVAGAQAACQRASDSYVTEIKNLSTGPRSQSPKAVIKVRRGRFKHTATDEKTGVKWTIKGRFTSSRRARGTFEASKFETRFNPFNPYVPDSQLCSGKGSWKASR